MHILLGKILYNKKQCHDWGNPNFPNFDNRYDN